MKPINKKMIRILFICHGNICRSPMAEFAWNDILEGCEGLLAELKGTDKTNKLRNISGPKI